MKEDGPEQAVGLCVRGTVSSEAVQEHGETVKLGLEVFVQSGVVQRFHRLPIETTSPWP